VVLKPSTPVLDAARAIENNNIGAVVVQDQNRVVGIVTDRDLTVRVLGYALNPRTTPLAEVMTTPVATLAPADSQSDALRLMQQRNIRRIPLVEAGRLVGIVTLDDLLLDEAAPLDQVAAVVQGQIGEGGPAASPRSPAARRRAARAQATYGRLLNRLRADADLETSEQVETALEVVLESLVRRLTLDEAKDLIAQLPSLLQPTLRALPPGPDKLITRQTIENELGERLDVDQPRAAQLLDVVGATVAQIVSPGQIQDVRGQLPEGLRSVLSDPVPVGSWPA
jgi:uncharacterized protein (DUF2267 family)/predicted transcriptional regulator